MRTPLVVGLVAALFYLNDSARADDTLRQLREALEQQQRDSNANLQQLADSLRETELSGDKLIKAFALQMETPQEQFNTLFRRLEGTPRHPTAQAAVALGRPKSQSAPKEYLAAIRRELELAGGESSKDLKTDSATRKLAEKLLDGKIPPGLFVNQFKNAQGYRQVLAAVTTVQTERTKAAMGNLGRETCFPQDSEAFGQFKATHAELLRERMQAAFERLLLLKQYPDGAVGLLSGLPSLPAHTAPKADLETAEVFATGLGEFLSHQLEYMRLPEKGASLDSPLHHVLFGRWQGKCTTQLDPQDVDDALYVLLNGREKHPRYIEWTQKIQQKESFDKMMPQSPPAQPPPYSAPTDYSRPPISPPDAAPAIGSGSHSGASTKTRPIPGRMTRPQNNLEPRPRPRL